MRKQKVFCCSFPLLSQRGLSVNHGHYSCRFRLVTISPPYPNTCSWDTKGYSDNKHSLGWKHQKALLTCNQARDNERKNQHLEHTHQQLSWEGEILDLAIGQLVGPKGKCQDDPCESTKNENGNGKVWSSGLSLSQSYNMAFLFLFSFQLLPSAKESMLFLFQKVMFQFLLYAFSPFDISVCTGALCWTTGVPLPAVLSAAPLESVPRKLITTKEMWLPTLLAQGPCPATY